MKYVFKNNDILKIDVYKPLNKMNIDDFIKLLLKEKNNILIEEKVVYNINNEFYIKEKICSIEQIENNKVETKPLNKNIKILFTIGDLYGLIKYNYFHIINKDKYLNKKDTKILKKNIK